MASSGSSECRVTQRRFANSCLVPSMWTPCGFMEVEPGKQEDAFQFASAAGSGKFAHQADMLATSDRAIVQKAVENVGDTLRAEDKRR